MGGLGAEEMGQGSSRQPRRQLVDNSEDNSVDNPVDNSISFKDTRMWRDSLRI